LVLRRKSYCYNGGIKGDGFIYSKLDLTHFSFLESKWGQATSRKHSGKRGLSPLTAPTSVAGVSTVRYQIPAYDRAGNVVGFKDKVFPKTVYDPKIFTDQKILDLGQQAAASGYKEALSKGLSQYDSIAGSVTFRVYLDKATGTVTNFHPK